MPAGAIVPFVAPAVGAGKLAAALKGLGYLTTGLSGAALLGGTGLGLYDVYKQFTDKEKLIGDFTDIEENVDGIRKLNPYQSLRRISIDALNPDVNIDNSYIQDETDILAAKRKEREQQLALETARRSAEIEETNPEYKLRRDNQDVVNNLAKGRLGLDWQIAQGNIDAANRNALRQHTLDKLQLQNQADSRRDNYQFKLQELDLMRQRDQMAYDQFLEREKFRKEERRQKRMDALLLALTGLTSDSIRYL